MTTVTERYFRETTITPDCPEPVVTLTEIDPSQMYPPPTVERDSLHAAPEGNWSLIFRSTWGDDEGGKVDFTNGQDSPFGIEDHRRAGHKLILNTASVSGFMLRLWVNMVAALAVGLTQIGSRLLDYISLRDWLISRSTVDISLPRHIRAGFQWLAFLQWKATDATRNDPTFSLEIKRVGDLYCVWLWDAVGKVVYEQADPLLFGVGEKVRLHTEYVRGRTVETGRVRVWQETKQQRSLIFDVAGVTDFGGLVAFGPCCYTNSARGETKDEIGVDFWQMSVWGKAA